MKGTQTAIDLQLFAEDTADVESTPEQEGGLDDFDAFFGPGDADNDTPTDTSDNEPAPAQDDEQAGADDQPATPPAQTQETGEQGAQQNAPSQPRKWAGKYDTVEALKSGTRQLAKRFGLPEDGLEFGSDESWESAYSNLFKRFSQGEHLADNPAYQATQQQRQQAATPQQQPGAQQPTPADQPAEPTPEEAEAAKQQLLQDLFTDPEAALLKIGERLFEQRMQPILQPIVQAGAEQSINAALSQFASTHDDFNDLQDDINEHIKSNPLLQRALATKDPDVIPMVLETAYNAVRGSTRDAAIQAAIEAARAEGAQSAQSVARAQTAPASSRAAQAAPAQDDFTELFGEPERPWE